MSEQIVPPLTMISGDNAGMCGADSCELPTPERPEEAQDPARPGL